MRHLRLLTAGCIVMLTTPAVAADTEAEALRQELDALKQQVQQLEDRLEQATADDRLSESREDKSVKEIAKATYKEASKKEIDVGGAVRFQLSRRGRDNNDRATVGEIDLDTVRINFGGEYRFYSSARFIHHGWVGYDFTENWQGRLGIQQVPFGITPYSSHNFFFSSNYYLGLEDDYDSGINALYTNGAHDLQIAFFKNDEYSGGNDFD